MGAARQPHVLAVLVVLVVALAVRVAPVIAAHDSFHPQRDAADFDRHAVSLARFGRYPPSAVAPGSPSAFRPPAYPYLLAGAYFATGTAHSTDRWLVGRLVGALLGVIVVAMLGLIARTLFDRRVALAAMVIAAVYPPLVVFSDALLSEGLFTALALGVVAFCLEARVRDRPAPWLAAAGALVGLAALTRTNGLVLIIPALVAAVGPAGRGQRLRTAAVVVIPAVLVLVPWTVRNAIVFDRFVLTSTQTGFTLAGTYNDVSRHDPRLPGAWRPVAPGRYARVLRRRDLNEAQKDAHLTRLALAYAAGHPGYPLVVAWHNTGRLFGLADRAVERSAAPESGIRSTVAELDVYAFWLLAAFALAGMLTYRARQTPLFVWLVPVLLWATVVFVIAYARYRVPGDAFLVLPASLALATASARTPPNASPSARQS